MPAPSPRILSRLLPDAPVRPRRLVALPGPACHLDHSWQLRVSQAGLAEKFSFVPGGKRTALDPDLWPHAFMLAPPHQAGPSLPALPRAGDEAFALRADATGLAGAAGGERGFRYLLDTLRRLLQAHPRRLPPFLLEDWPVMAIRGVMIDVARQVERFSYLKELAARLAEHRCNLLMLYFEDKLAFSRHPKLRHPLAYSLAQMAELSARCRELGIELVACMATLGHCENFLRVKEYRRLADGDRIYQLNPFHPGTRRMLADMFADWRRVVPSRHFHAACDEAPYIGHSPDARAFLRRHGKEAFYAHHLNWLHAELKARGYRMMVWGDMLKHHPKTLELIPRDIIVCEWNYGAVGERDAAALALYKEKGFASVVCPAASRSAQIHFPDRGQLLHNIPALVKLGVEHGALGVLNCQWECFTRFPAWSEPGFLLSSVLAWEGRDFFSRQARQRAFAHFSGRDGAQVDRLFQLLSPHLLLERFGRLHRNREVQEKTYHVDVHELIPGDPLIYLKYAVSPWERRLQRNYEAGHALARRLFPGSDPLARLLRFGADSCLLLAWKRVKINEAGILFRQAAAAHARDRRADAARLLAAALQPLAELKGLAARLHRQARSAWAIQRYPADPAFAKIYGGRLRLMVRGVARLERQVRNSLRRLRRTGQFDLGRRLAARHACLFRIKLKSREDVNILRLDVSLSPDGRNWRRDRTVGAFQIPGSDYLYMWMPPGNPPRFLRVEVTQTRTAWTPAELELSLVRPLGLAENPKLVKGKSIATEEFCLIAAGRRYRCRHLTRTQGVFELE